MNEPQSGLKILVLCNEFYPASCVGDHIGAIKGHSGHDCVLFDPTMEEKLRFDPGRFDVLVIHYSLWVENPHVITPPWREAIRKFDGPKVQFLHDEYRNVAKIKESVTDLGIVCLMSVVPEDKLGDFYGDLEGVRLESILTGYVPARMLRETRPAMEKRGIDVGYRGRTYSYSLGRLAYEKAIIGDVFLEEVNRLGLDLKCDISSAEEDRIYGKRWDSFLKDCRAVLGTESGASVIDWDGSVGREVDAYLADYPGAGFDEVSEKVLKPYDGKLVLNTIAPKHFEAAAIGTLQVQFPGEYSGIMEAWKHYVPLERDLSNLREVVDVIRDPKKAGEIADRAYEDLIGSGRYSYEEFGKTCGRIFSEVFAGSDLNFREGERSYYTKGEISRRSIYWRRIRSRFLWKLSSVSPRAYGLLLKTVGKLGSARSYARFSGRLGLELKDQAISKSSKEMWRLAGESMSRAQERKVGERPSLSQIFYDLRWLRQMDNWVHERSRTAAQVEILGLNGSGASGIEVHADIVSPGAGDERAGSGGNGLSAKWEELLRRIRAGMLESLKLRVRGRSELPKKLCGGIRGEIACAQKREGEYWIAERRTEAVPELFRSQGR